MVFPRASTLAGLVAQRVVTIIDDGAVRHDGRGELAFAIVKILVNVAGRILDRRGLAIFVVLDRGRRVGRVDSRRVAGGGEVGVGHAAGVVVTVDIGSPVLESHR